MASRPAVAFSFTVPEGLLFLLPTLFASPTVGPCTVERTTKPILPSLVLFVCFEGNLRRVFFLTLWLKGTPKYCRICLLGKKLRLHFWGRFSPQFDDCAYFFRWVGNQLQLPKTPSLRHPDTKVYFTPTPGPMQPGPSLKKYLGFLPIRIQGWSMNSSESQPICLLKGNSTGSRSTETVSGELPWE